MQVTSLCAAKLCLVCFFLGCLYVSACLGVIRLQRGCHFMNNALVCVVALLCLCCAGIEAQIFLCHDW